MPQAKKVTVDTPESLGLIQVPGTSIIRIDDDLAGHLKLEDRGSGYLVRAFSIQREQHADDLTDEIVSIISTERVDRGRLKIALSGWKLRQYRKLPVVLFSHDYMGLPIGRGRVWVDREREALMGGTRYLDHEFAQDVQKADVAKVLGCSVGFLPLKWEALEETEEDQNRQKNEWERAGIFYKSQELMEFSKTPIPANPDAVSLAMEGTAESIGELRRMVRRMARNPKSVVVPGASEERQLDTWPCMTCAGVKESIEALATRIDEIEPKLDEAVEVIRAFGERFGPKTPWRPETLPETARRSPEVDMGDVIGRLQQVVRGLKSKKKGGEN